MRRMTPLITASPRQEIITTSKSGPVERGEEFRSAVAVEIREAEGVGCYVPAGAEPQEVGEGDEGVVGVGC